MDAVVAAVVEEAAALGRIGRQEYRLTVAGSEMIVIPGLAGDGLVDLESLRAIAGRWRPTGADATLTIPPQRVAKPTARQPCSALRSTPPDMPNSLPGSSCGPSSPSSGAGS